MRVIYLFTFSGRHYAVWKDAVESVRKIETIHRLPFSPAGIVGLTIIDKHSTALADLAALIGLPPLNRTSQAQLLFVAGQKKEAGFVITGDIAELSIPEESVQPMPAYVATPEISTCIIYQEKPVPLIDLKALYQHIHAKDLNPSVPTLPVPDKHPSSSGITSVKPFTAGGADFAFPADMVANVSDRPHDIVKIPLTPESLKGIISQGNSIIPVIDLAEKMNLPKQKNAAKLLLVDIGGDNFGFLVDNDLEVFSEKDFSIQPLPPLAKSPLINAAAIHNQEIIPIVDPLAIIATDPDSLDDIALADQYRPDSDFSGRFNHEEAEVVEFALLGERHALPRSEVGDILPIANFRRVPNLESLVIGIIEYQGEILPVLDPALVFGRRSPIISDGKMVLINNGDFRAFIVTEAIHQERRLPLNIQKKVPLSLSNRLVYGCYPDGNSVRLIINVAALAVHFDKMVVKKFLSSLTKEMAATAAEIVPALLPAEEVLRLKKEAARQEIAEPHEPENSSQAKTGGGEKQPGPAEARHEELAESEERQQGEAETSTPQKAAQMDPAAELMVLEQPAESSSAATNGDPAGSTELPKLLSDEVLPPHEQEFENISGNEATLTRHLAEKLDQLDEVKLQPNEVEKVGPGQDAESVRAQKISADQPRQQVTVNKALLEQEKEAAGKAEEEKLKLAAEIEKERARAEKILEQQKQDAQALAIAEEQRRKQEEELDKQRLAAEAEEERIRMQKILARQKQKKAREEAERLRLEIESKNKAEAQVLKQQIEERQRLEEMMLARAEEETQKIGKEQQIREPERERVRILAGFRDRKKKNKKDNKRLLVLLSLLLLLLLNIFIFFDIPGREQPEPPVGEKDLSTEMETGPDKKTKPPVITADIKKPSKTEPIPARYTNNKTKPPVIAADIKKPSKTEPIPARYTNKKTKPPVITADLKKTNKPAPIPARYPIKKAKPPVIAADLKKTRKPAPIPARDPKPKKAPKEEFQPLTIIVPDNIPVATHTYKVKKGDTLWDISLRFTGTPYNYPLVAQENDIANPNLIFPEQPILLKRKKKP